PLPTTVIRVCGAGSMAGSRVGTASARYVPLLRGRLAMCTAEFRNAPFNVRGARNLSCITVPGKRAPTAKMCESNEYYVPLNDGYNWRGDPNATLSGQPIPPLPPGSPPAQAAP